MKEILFTNVEYFNKVVDKIQNIIREINKQKRIQKSELEVAEGWLEFEKSFNKYNNDITKLYKNLETTIKDSIVIVDLTNEQGNQIIEIVEEAFRMWQNQLEQLKEFVKSHIKTSIVYFSVKILDKSEEISDLISKNQRTLEKILKEVKEIWEKNRSRIIIKQVIDAFNKEQTINYKKPYDEEGNLWEVGAEVKKEDLGIETPKISEKDNINFAYFISKIDLSINLVEVKVRVTIKKDEKLLAEDFVVVKIRGFIDEIKFDHYMLQQFIDNFADNQQTKHLNQKIFTWKINDTNEVNSKTLGIEEPENIVRAKLQYTIIGIDFNKGIVKVRLDASKHSLVIPHYITINGFYNATEDLNALKQKLTFMTSNNFALDLKQKLKVKDQWKIVIEYIKNYLKDEQVKKDPELIDNLDFKSESLNCNELDEEIINTIGLHQKIIEKKMRVTLAESIDSSYNFAFVNYFNRNEALNHAAEDFAKKFILKQITKKPNSIEPLSWAPGQTFGIYRENLGIVEPFNKFQLDVQYSIQTLNIGYGALTALVTINASDDEKKPLDHQTTRLIEIDNFKKSKEIFNKIKNDLQKISENKSVIDFEKEISANVAWKKIVEQIVYKLKQIEPLVSYDEEHKNFLNTININPLVHNLDEVISKHKNFTYENFGKNFELRIGHLNLGSFTLYFQGFRAGHDETRFFIAYDEDGNPKKLADGNYVRPQLLLTDVWWATDKKVVKKFVIYDDIHTFINDEEELKYFYESIEIHDAEIEIKLNQHAQNYKFKDITIIKTKDFKFGKPIKIFEDFFKSIFEEQPAELFVTFSLNEKYKTRQLIATFEYRTENPKFSTIMWTTLFFGSLKFVAKPEHESK